MSSHPYKPRPDSLPVKALKLLWTVLTLTLVAGFYGIIFWGITLLHPPQWLAIPMACLLVAAIVTSYLALKLFTTLGKHLLDVPFYF